MGGGTVDALGTIVDVSGAVIVACLARVVAPDAFFILSTVRSPPSITPILTLTIHQEIRPILPTLSTKVPPSPQIVTIFTTGITVKLQHHIVIIQPI